MASFVHWTCVLYKYIISISHKQLVQACKTGDVGGVQRLLSRGAKVNTKSKGVCTCLFLRTYTI